MIAFAVQSHVFPYSAQTGIRSAVDLDCREVTTLSCRGGVLVDGKCAAGCTTMISIDVDSPCRAIAESLPKLVMGAPIETGHRRSEPKRGLSRPNGCPRPTVIERAGRRINPGPHSSPGMTSREAEVRVGVVGCGY